MKRIFGTDREDVFQPRWRALVAHKLCAVRLRMSRLAATLAREYGTPDLGNVSDALAEAVYIILTYQTDIPRARDTWHRLRLRFPTWTALLGAPVLEVERTLQPSGLQRAKARVIRQLLEAVERRWGELSLASLVHMTDVEAERELRALPGLDIKGARCVLLYALRRPVFPVDSNSFRFMQRFGVIAVGTRYRRAATHDALQNLVAPADRYRLHVNLVVHGQTTCLPRRPRCSACAVRRTCAAAPRQNS